MALDRTPWRRPAASDQAATSNPDPGGLAVTHPSRSHYSRSLDGDDFFITWNHSLLPRTACAPMQAICAHIHARTRARA